MQLPVLLMQPLSLPSIPKVVALLLSALQRAEVDLKEVNQLIATDPALTTRLLQLANAAPLGLGGRIHSVSQALALLHLQQVQSMAEQAAAAASLKAISGVSMQQFWQYCLNVAKVSRSLASVLRSNPQAAFTCGLIHAVGELAMQRAMPQTMASIDKISPALDLRRAQAEQAQLGYCYSAVGAGLARQWQFPQPMVDALEHLQDPFGNGVYEPLAGIIHLAVWRARGKEARLKPYALADTFPGSVGLALGLDIDMVLQQDPFEWSMHR